MVKDPHPYWITLYTAEQGIPSLISDDSVTCFESAHVTLDGHRVWSTGRGHLVKASRIDTAILRVKVRLPGHLEPITYTYEIAEYTMPDGVEGDWYLTTTAGVLIVIVQTMHSKKLRVRQIVYNDIVKRSYLARTVGVSLHDHGGTCIAQDYERIVMRRMVSENNSEKYRWI